MALDVNTFHTQASEAGTAQKKEYFDYMDALLTNQQQIDTDSLNTQYNNLLNNLNASLGTDLRENYIQQTISNQQVNAGLNRTGVGTSGYGATQRTLNNNQYAGMRGDILAAHNLNTKDTEIDRATSLMDLMSDYMDKRATAYDNSWMRYDQGYGNMYGALNDALDQQNWQLEFDEAQRQFDAGQALGWAQLAASGSGGSNDADPIFGWSAGDVKFKQSSNGNVTYYNSDGAEATVKAGQNPFTGTTASGVKYNADGTIDTSSVFSNMYQPNTVNGLKLSKTYTTNSDGKKVALTATQDYGNGNSQTQNVWKDTKGNYWMWNGIQNKYVAYTGPTK